MSFTKLKKISEHLRQANCYKVLKEFPRSPAGLDWCTSSGVQGTGILLLLIR
jgi:hypothetical protein